jgi:hypothetical protein
MWSFIKLMIWGLIWTPAWVATTILRNTAKKPRLDNCLSWALRKWDEEGGYLVIRWCRLNRVPWVRWPHFLWLPPQNHEELRHFVPRGDSLEQERRVFPDAWFIGKIQKGDDKDVMEN